MRSINSYIALFGLSYVGVQGRFGSAPNIRHNVVSPQHQDLYQQSITDSNKEYPIQLDPPSTEAADQILYSPARGPALPLAVRSPYTSAWISTAKNGSLNSAPAVFWDGSPLGWEGIIMVDGIAYEWLGVGSKTLPLLSNFKKATPRSVAYDSQYSNFTVDAGPVRIVASFFSSVLPQDLCRTSVPLSYVSVTAQSTDGAGHNVSLYTDVNGAWVTQPSAPLTWNLYADGVPVSGGNSTNSTSALYTWIIQLQNQYLFGEAYGQGNQGVFPQWGNFSFTSSKGQAQNLNFQSGYSVNQRFQFVTGSALMGTIDQDYRAYDSQEPVFAFEHQLGLVSPATPVTVRYTIGYVVEPAIRILTTIGIEPLQPWWKKCYGDLFSMIKFHWNDLAQSQTLAASFEAKLRRDINAYYGLNASIVNEGDSPSPATRWKHGKISTSDSMTDQQYYFDSDDAYGYLEPTNGCNSTGVAFPNITEAEAYYSIVALAARQIMGAYVLTVPSSTAKNQSQPYSFQKEISSNGNVNTVDVIFPAMPFFLWSNPDLIRYVLDPLFLNQETNFYPNDYAMHDLGAHFPNATGHVEGDDEYMPVEESGNMIIMVYAIYKFTNDLSYLQSHYKILLQWAQYLIEYTLIPAVQLSTDDFAGKLANQTNLAIKGIVGLAAMAEISTAVSDPTSAQNFSQIATNYYDMWSKMAIDPSGHHTLLSYQWRSSWGLLYNVYPAKLLNLSIIPQSLYDMQSDFYPTVSQLWGVPLDSRHDWTKSDWELWTAAYCKPDTRKLIVNALAYWLNTTSSSLPFTDLYQTDHTGETPADPYLVTFLARPVQGGLYSLLALLAGGTN